MTNTTIKASAALRMDFKSCKNHGEDDLSHPTGWISLKKDIFAVFAYEFELSQNSWFLVKSFAYAHGEIIYSVNCEI